MAVPAVWCLAHVEGSVARAPLGASFNETRRNASPKGEPTLRTDLSALKALRWNRQSSERFHLGLFLRGYRTRNLKRNAILSNIKWILSYLTRLSRTQRG